MKRNRPETSVLAFSPGRLATNFPLLPRRLQLPIPIGGLRSADSSSLRKGI